MENELWIWRPILAGKCTLEAVVSGLVSVEMLLKLNALLDMSEAHQAFANDPENQPKVKNK